MVSPSRPPSASIVVPTRTRPRYLEVTLASIAPQAGEAGAELIVVDDAGPSVPVRELSERFGARYEPHPRPLGLNVARNTGVERSSGELVVFVDDDVEVCEGWLRALLAAARNHPDVDVLTGPIIPRLEGSPPHSCGREGPPITALYLGSEDAPARFAWGANMTIRRAALEHIGPFDVSLEHGGDEQEWQERLRSEPSANGGSHGGILYVADAALHHRRTPADSRLSPLCRAAFARGKAARRFDAWRGERTNGADRPGERRGLGERRGRDGQGGPVPGIPRELATLAGCLGHVLYRRCPAGLVMVAHSAGRLEEALRATATASTPAIAAGEPPGGRSTVTFPPTVRPSGPDLATDDFLSGESGTVGGLDGIRRGAHDRAVDALEIASGRRLRLRLAARHSPVTRSVLVLGIERPEHRDLAQGIRAELECSRHDLELHFAAPAEKGKFENLNLLLDAHPPRESDWLLVVDDDIVLPRGFLDRFLFLAEHFRLDLAQPAHRRASHAAWQVTRRQPGSALHETSFVEIGPLTAFARSTFSTLLPFPELRMGWGLDMHWAAIAREQGWRCGVIDAVPIRHRVAPAASSYSREQALAEARAFLRDRPYLSASEAQRTLVTHRRW
jgi:GT2 family glycosyltransferase